MNQLFRRIVPTFAIVGFFAAAQAGAAEPSKTSALAVWLNVLLMADDLAATLACYGHPYGEDAEPRCFGARVVPRSLLSVSALQSFAFVDDVRLAALARTRVTNNEDNDKNIPDVLTLPHHFRNQGYATARCGKIFHLGVPSGLESMDDPLAWELTRRFVRSSRIRRVAKASSTSASRRSKGSAGKRFPATTINFATAICQDGRRVVEEGATLRGRSFSRSASIARTCRLCAGQVLRSILIRRNPSATLPPTTRRHSASGTQRLAVPGYTLAATPEHSPRGQFGPISRA